MFVLQLLYVQHFTIHGLEVVATCTVGYVSKERWGKVDLGYILDESYDHTKLPKIPCREFFKPTYPVFAVPGAKRCFFWLSVPVETFVFCHFVITRHASLFPCPRSHTVAIL
jgi:hypothetical protein